MKFVLVKKKMIIILTCFALTLSMFVASLSATSTASIYFGYAPRKLPIYCVDADEKKIAISFDASWGNEKSDKILEILQSHDIVANYFVVGFWADKYKDTLKKLSDSGRVEIGTHSNNHLHMSKMSKKEIEQDLQSSIKRIEAVTNKPIELFRAPFGEYNDTLLEVANSQKLFTIQWDVDSLDWKDISAQEITKRVLSRVNNGSIILFHNDGKHTVEALPIIIEALKNKGYTFCTISNLIYKNNFSIDNSGKQIRS